jgi:hypothetical protein
VSAKLHSLLTPSTRRHGYPEPHICPQSNNTRDKQMTTSKTKEQRDYSVYMATATVRCFHSVSEFKTQGEKKNDREDFV